MTLKAIIEEVDRQRPNAFSELEKTEMLNRLEMQIADEIFGTLAAKLDWSVDRNSELLLSAPYDDIYVIYLMAQIDFRNGDYSRYNNELSQFDQRFTDAQASYLRRHKPRRKWFKWFP